MRIRGFRYAPSGCVAAALLGACGGSQSPTIVPGINGMEQVLSHHLTFHYTGNEQLFKAPAGVKWITVVALGAAGGGLGGRGGRVFAEVPVMQGEELAVFVGGTTTSASGGYNGGGNGAIYSSYSSGGYGGGGATDIREGGTELHDRVLVAGGGGSSYIEPSARSYESWKGWKTATGNGLVVFSWSRK
jgi:Glycine rich protein